MSIVACVKVFDGLVLGAESMTQVFANVGGQTQHIKSYSNARKLFQIGSLPVGVLTYGAGNIGNRSIESFLEEFSAKYTPKDEHRRIDQITAALHKFMREPYDEAFKQVDAAQKPQLGFYVAGYSTGQHLGSEFEFLLPQATPPMPARSDDRLGASWRGVSFPFSRLFVGVDPRIEALLAKVGVSPDTIQKLHELVTQDLTTKVVFDGMPIQDAVGFCRFIIDTTVGTAKYEIGMPSCGGPVHMAVITRTGGFRWVAGPSLKTERVSL